MKHPYVTKEGTFFQLIYYMNGRRRKITTKQTNRYDATEFMNKFLANDFSVKQYQYIKLSDYLKEWIILKSGNKNSSINNYKNAFNQLIKFSGDKHLNQYSLSELTYLTNLLLSPYNILKAGFIII